MDDRTNHFIGVTPFPLLSHFRRFKILPIFVKTMYIIVATISIIVKTIINIIWGRLISNFVEPPIMTSRDDITITPCKIAVTLAMFAYVSAKQSLFELKRRMKCYAMLRSTTISLPILMCMMRTFMVPFMSATPYSTV